MKQPTQVEEESKEEMSSSSYSEESEEQAQPELVSEGNDIKNINETPQIAVANDL